MPKRTIILIYTLLSAQLLLSQAPKKYIYLDDPTNTYIDYLINSGKLETDFVLWQPYQTSHLDSVNSNSKAYRYFKKFWLRYYQEDDVSFQLDAGSELRYQEKAYNRWQAKGGVHFFAPHVSFGNRTSINQD